MTIALVLDTNVLRTEGLTSRNMQRLARLAASGEVEVCVPEFVMREFNTQRALKGSEVLADWAKEVNELTSFVRQHKHIVSKFQDIKAIVADISSEFEGAVAAEFEHWAKSANVSSVKFNPADTAAVIDDYFAGTGAFRRAKHRDDIPDAFVSASIRQLLDRHMSVHIAVRDGALKKHLESEKRYLVLDGLPEFFELAEVKQTVAKLDQLAKNVEELKATLSSPDVQGVLGRYLCQANELLEDVYLEEDQVDGLVHLGIRQFGGSLNYAQAASITLIEWSEVSYIDRGHFAIAVKIHTKARIDYCADYSDYLNLSKERSSQVEEVSFDDGISDLEEVRSVVLKGHLDLTFDDSWSSDVFKAHLQHLSAKPPQVTLVLDIQRALVQ